MGKQRKNAYKTFFPQQFFKKNPSASRMITIEENGVIEFSQIKVNREVTSGKLHEIKIKYNGLCETPFQQ